MGLANLVPGISGGTMLLATGVYPRFVAAVAEVSRLRVTREALAVLAAVAGAAAVAILLLAGPVRELVITRRWIMYSLFIGLTLGGVPIVWRLARPPRPGFWAGTAAGVAVMALMAWGAPADGSSGWTSPVGYFVGGLAGAAAMILPGVSGGYLLLVLGLYLPILGGIDALRRGLVDPLLAGGAPDLALAQTGIAVAIPVGLGVVVGVAGVSNAIRGALRRFPQATLGVLMGLLLGAVLGLWPFAQPVAEAGAGAAADPDELVWAPYRPGPAQAAGSLLLVLAGFAATQAIGRLGSESESLDL